MNKTFISVAVVAVTIVGIGSANTAHADGTTPPPWDFYAVPQLGHEAVRGTGCGGDGSIGDVIPDGYWRGYLASDDGTSIQFDLACVYLSEVSGSTSVPDGWLVNNNTRTRTVPRSPSFFSSGTRFQADGAVPFFQTVTVAEGGNFDGDNVPFDGTDAWLSIENGRAQWAVGSPVNPSPVEVAQTAPSAGAAITQTSIDVTYKVVLPLPCTEVPTRSDFAAFYPGAEAYITDSTGTTLATSQLGAATPYVVTLDEDPGLADGPTYQEEWCTFSSAPMQVPLLGQYLGGVSGESNGVWSHADSSEIDPQDIADGAYELLASNYS